MIFQIKIQQKAVLQSLHLNAFPPVFFFLYFLSILICNKKQFCRVCTLLLFPLHVSFSYSFNIRLQKKQFSDCALESFILSILSNQNYKSKKGCIVCTWMLFPLHVLFFMLFEIKITAKSSFLECVLECFFHCIFHSSLFSNSDFNKNQFCRFCTWIFYS